MKKKAEEKKIFGLVGKNISYSFSRAFFIEKFQRESIKNTDYQIFDLQDIRELKTLLKNPFLRGVNVTTPYKEKAVALVDEISNETKKVGAINTIKIENQKLIGYNTDIIGFELSFKKRLKLNQKKALVLGTGGAAKAVCFALENLSIEYLLVSREKKPNSILYEEITAKTLEEYLIVINATPLGTYPNLYDSPPIPYLYLSEKHYLYDLIYNPNKSSFLKKGEAKKAFIKNGLEMLYIQAEASWNIWQ